jgi:predicted ATPase
VEVCFAKALDWAGRQQAKSFQLRAATSLARLWRDRGRHRDAHDLLMPVYEWFTEGFDTPDLRDATTLLDELRNPGRRTS